MQWKSDTCAGCFGSDLAVDGDTNQNFGHRSCAHTDTNTKSTPVSWSVNFEGSYYLLGINVYNSMSILLVGVRTRVCMCVFACSKLLAFAVVGLVSSYRHYYITMPERIQH